MPPRKAAGGPPKRGGRGTPRSTGKKAVMKSDDKSQSPLPSTSPETANPTSPRTTDSVSPGKSPTVVIAVVPMSADGASSESKVTENALTVESEVKESAVTINETLDGEAEAKKCGVEADEVFEKSDEIVGVEGSETTAEGRTVSSQLEGSVTENGVKGVGEMEIAGGKGNEKDNVTGTKMVVKKKIKIVKKIVKKKKLVPKRLDKGLSDCSSKELDKLQAMDDDRPAFVENAQPIGKELMEVGKKDEQGSNIAVSKEAENTYIAVPAYTAKTKVLKAQPEKNLDDVKLADPDLDNPAREEKNKSEKRISGSEVLFDTRIQHPISRGSERDEMIEVNLATGCKAEMKQEDNCDPEGDVNVILSGEMEALQRRRRRKTEIFVGGLDKNTTEEEVKKVFEEAGEILEVRLAKNSQTGKNRGYAFVRYKSAADAKKALTKYSKVEICGKQCGASPVEGNDTIFLGNIDKKWTNEDVLKLVQEAGIEKIDKVTVMPDPTKVGCNRGFAFLELETTRDGQNAYRILQKKDAFGKQHSIKVAWAEPLNEPDEEEMFKVKSVYAEYVPSSWDEEKVGDYFSKYGEIDNIVLAKNLHSSKRKDFAFVNYRTREAALSCIESFSHNNMNNEGSKVRVSLAKPTSKGKPKKQVSKPNKQVTNFNTKESSKGKEKTTQVQSGAKTKDFKIQGISSKNKYDQRNIDATSTRDADLLRLLREQALRRHSQTELGRGILPGDYPYTLTGMKRTYSDLLDDPLYSELRGYPRARLESSNSLASAGTSYSASLQGGRTPLRYYRHQGAGYPLGSLYGTTDRTRSALGGELPYLGGSGGLYYRY